MLPTNFIIYRDGVGDAQRQHILDREVSQFKEAIADSYGVIDKLPEITLIVVNKRINQRFFMEDQSGQLRNPPCGCIIDSKLVMGDEKGNEKFDFYMTPATATQGCIQPTHFYVSKNESSLTKLQIQQFSYALCHYYFNWSGPIKVPAPAQYAHKIAEFFMTIGVTTRGKRRSSDHEQKAQARAIMDKVDQEIDPLDISLHFL